ncbi:undecaprenyl-diphosphate phosphatase [bacterium CPR1]|nr:undecaprenyl-diphosphate phosphatase [bacterium CPR1]
MSAGSDGLVSGGSAKPPPDERPRLAVEELECFSTNPGAVTNLLQVFLLGVIEGITEFLPISSTGHLLVAEKLGLGMRSEMFNIVIQAGAILAVVLIYRTRLWNLCVGFSRAENRDYALKLMTAFFITGELGLVAKKLGFELPDTVGPIAWALIIGGLWMLVAEWLAARKPPQSEITWKVAVVVGLAQVVAGIFPGTSRSAATIFAAMLTGTSDRAAATEFAFLVGIPTMFAASGYELAKQMKDGAAPENWGDLGLAFVVSTITAFIAVKWLLKYIQTHQFTVFAVYRLVAGVLLLLLVDWQ